MLPCLSKLALYVATDDSQMRRDTFSVNAYQRLSSQQIVEGSGFVSQVRAFEGALTLGSSRAHRVQSLVTA